MLCQKLVNDSTFLGTIVMVLEKMALLRVSHHALIHIVAQRMGLPETWRFLTVAHILDVLFCAEQPVRALQVRKFNAWRVATLVTFAGPDTLVFSPGH